MFFFLGDFVIVELSKERQIVPAQVVNDIIYNDNELVGIKNDQERW